jgi:hypothetical protein
MAGRLTFVGVLVGIIIAAPTLPLYTPARARVFRWAKWPVIVTAAALALGSNTFDWAGAFAICFGAFFWTEWAKASIRRKLPAEKWPRQVYL